MAIIEISITSIMTILYPDKITDTIGMIEAAGGIGVGIGPFIGSILFLISGFSLVFAI